ncbi:MAG: FAD-dependent oxidoreductase [Fimbriimonadaceae bacterium]|nr:FAD-dependent oxidoreductase [Fimbriimonadaceae bacterium]
MRVAIVGAGMAGLGAGRRLSRHGWNPVLFEIEDHVGGRIVTEALGPYVFDSGATDLAPGSTNLADEMFQGLDTSELRLIEKPIYTHESLRVSPGGAMKNRLPRYTYLHGNQKLPEMLAEGLDVRTGLGVGALKRSGDEYVVAGEPFDAVILTPPVPEIEPLLASISEMRPLANTYYRPCLTVLLGYAHAVGEVPYHALLDQEQRHPLVWLSIETEKCAGRAPDGHTAFVAQLGPQYSQSYFGSEDEAIIASVAGYLSRLYGEAFLKPEVAEVRRWKHAQPETYAMFDTVNQTHSRLLVASDGVLGARVEFAYEAGIRAAKLLLAQ